MVFNSNTTDTSSSLPSARDAVAEEDAGSSSTSGEEVTQGGLNCSGTMQKRNIPLFKPELGVGLVGNDVLVKTSERDPLEAETESYLSQVQVFCFTFVLF